MIQEGIYELLAANVGISALVGTQIFVGDAPPDLKQYPCITYSLVGGSWDPTLRNSGTIRQRVEFNGHAAAASGGNGPAKVAAQIRQAVILAVLKTLHPLDGAGSVLLADGTRVVDVKLLNPGTDFVTEDRIFRCMCEFYVYYTLPTS